MSEVLEGYPLLEPSTMSPPLDPVLVTDGAGLIQVGSFLERVCLLPDPALGLDVETDIQENFLDTRIRTIQVGNRDESYVIDLLAFAETKERMFSEQGFRRTTKCFEPVVNTLRPYLDSNRVLKVGHNLQFEYEKLSWCLGLYTWHLWCTYMVEKVRWAGLIPFHTSGFWALDDCVSRYLHKRISKELQKSFDLETPLTREQVIYAALDTRVVLPIRKGQMMIADKEKLWETILIENDAIPAMGDMHINGFKLDREDWQQIVDEVTTTHTKNVERMDEKFLPVVGAKVMPAENLLELEQQWRALSDPTPEEQALRDKIKEKGHSKLEKDAWREEKNKFEEVRKAEKTRVGERYKAASKYANWFKKQNEKMEGKAGIVYSSPAQLRDALWKFEGINKLLLPDTNDKSLSKLKAHYQKRNERPDIVELVNVIQDYRSSGKAKGSFGENLYEFYNAITGFIHALHSQIGTTTGRMSCEKPNLQQIPKDPLYRKCWKASWSWTGNAEYDAWLMQCVMKMITLDYDGAELRIMTEASQDPDWITAFNNDWDVHSVVAEKMRREEWIAAIADACAYVIRHAKCECPLHKKIRNDSKSVNFGIAYGLMAQGLADQLGITLERAEQLLALWHASNPVLSKKLKEWAEYAKMTGEARSLGNRRRLFKKPTWDGCRIKAKMDLEERKKKAKTPEEAARWDREPTKHEIARKYEGTLAGIGREGGNHKIQGTNADMTKLAVGCGYDSEGRPFFWHFSRPDKGKFFTNNIVHDEVVGSTPEIHEKESFDTLNDCMVRAGQRFIKTIPVKADGHIDFHWVK